MGDLKITVLQDGELPLGKDLLKGLDTAEAEKLLGGPGPVATSVNAFLVDTGKHRILVDAGGTSAWGIGYLAERLQKAGVNPESIGAVLITHLHGDHVGGLLTPEGKRAFPKAQVRLSQAEHDFWMDPATEASLPESRKPMMKAIKAMIATYQAEGAYHPFAPGEAPFTGVKAIPTPGHTPGHTSYAFGHGRNAFWAIGDIIHFGKVQFAKPAVTVTFDTDSPRAAATRLDLWERAAKGKVVMGGSHLAFPGMGRIEKRSEGFAWVELDGKTQH
ncbi:MBL fold metallo-hydrolase [Holophaga foetida]|uniref:MBL fold metallo-hydrolase n=1 Tax=Holophaga foetida TaxID=35839 RepID=UPI0002473ADE|nr:MBL fold metallo-hydrolase [Holophaga foetida]